MAVTIWRLILDADVILLASLISFYFYVIKAVIFSILVSKSIINLYYSNKKLVFSCPTYDC